MKRSYMNTRLLCPVCGGVFLQKHLNVSDYFLTGEDFNIDRCASCNFLFTNPYPDSNSIGRYYQSNDYLSHPKRGFTLLGSMYKFVRSLNIQTKYRSVTKNMKVGSVLDIGCGSGDFLLYCKQKGWTITGIEPDEAAREFATNKLNKQVLSPDDIDGLESQSFDLITLWHVLEHVENLDLQLSQIKRLLKLSGKLVIALPNHRSFDCELYKQFWAGWDVPRHLYHFDISAIKLLCEKWNLNMIEIIPMKWDAYYVSLLSEKYKKTMGWQLRAILNGWKSNRKALKSGEYSSLTYTFTHKFSG